MDLTQPATHQEDDYWNANIEAPADPPSLKEGTKLTDLPKKCLLQIFKWIPFQNLDDIIEFSPKWHQLVQDNIPVEVHLTDIGFRIAMHYFIGHSDLPKYLIKVIHSRVLDETLPNLRSPEDLHVLDFATHTELATYKHLIEKAQNLQELYFGYSSLLGAPLGEMDVDLPKLTLLYMADRAVEGKKKESDQRSILSRNIIGFLGKKFPSIQKIVICTEASRKTTAEYAKALINFIEMHSGSLKIIKFTVATSIYRCLEQMTIGQDEIEDLHKFENTFNKDLLANVQLSELDINFGMGFFPGFEQWFWIMKHQKGLSHLTLGTEKPLDPKIFEAPIKLSASNLVTVQIGVEVYKDQKCSEPEENRRRPLDCEIFEGCVNLKMLVLTGPPMTADRLSGKEILNLDKLPNDLFALAIENIHVETKQISALTREIMQKRRTLGRLSFQDIGTSPGFGVSLAMLDCWLNAQVMEEIIVKRGMNGEETRLHEYEHLIKFGVISPVAKCSVHAFFYPSFMEYRKPAECMPKQEKKLDNVPLPMSFM